MRGPETSASGVLWVIFSMLTIAATSPVAATSLTPSLFNSDPAAFAPLDVTASQSMQDAGDVAASTYSGSTGKGILIGILSAFGSVGVAVIVLAIFFFFKYTRRGRILLDRIGRPGEYDDEQTFLREEAEALEAMDELSRAEYLRAKGA
jgi:hypothetical protein